MADFEPILRSDDDLFVTMYGTKRYGISADARIFSYDDDRIVCNPWLKRINPDVPSSIGDSEGSSIVASLAQLVMYTFYGVLDAPIKLKYPDEPPTTFNCYYDAKLNLAKGVDTEKVYVGNEEFRFHWEYNGYRYFISRRGVTISVRRLFGNAYELQFIRWNYRYGYPWLNLPKHSGALHTAVWAIWSAEGYVPYYDVHHKDENLWNPSIDNLEMLPKGEHRRQHGGDGTHRMTTIDDVHYIFRRLQNKDPMYKIAQDYSKMSGLTEAESHRLVSRFLYKEIFPEIRKDYDLDREFYKANKNRETKLSDATVEKAIDMMLENNTTDREISRVSGLPMHYVRVLRTKEGSFMLHPVVLRRYDDVMKIGSNAAHRYYPRQLPDQTVRDIVDMLQRTNYTNKEIAEKFGCSPETVRSICRGEKSYVFAGPVERVFGTQSIRMRKDAVIELPEDDLRVVAIRERMKKF